MSEFPSVQNPLVLPHWLVEHLRTINDPKFDYAKKALDEGVFVEIAWDPPREGVSHGGIPWRS